MSNEEQKIGYVFTPVPTNLIFILDAPCLKLMSLLIQEESYQRAKNKLKDNYFSDAIKRLSIQMQKSDRNVKQTIKSLEEANLIDVIDRGLYHKPNLFKINWEKVKEIEQISVTDITNNEEIPIICKKSRAECEGRKKLAESALVENIPVEKVDEPTVKQSGGQNGGQNGSQSCSQLGGQSSRQLGSQSSGELGIQPCSQFTPPLSDNIDNKDNINNIDNNLYINNNIVNNGNMGETSSDPINTSNGEKEQETKISMGEKVTDASAPSQADAHNIVSMDRKEKDTSIGKQSSDLLSTSIGGNEQESKNLNDEQIVDASALSQADAQHIELSTLEERLNDYIDNRPEKVPISTRVMEIGFHFPPSEHEAIESIVTRKDNKQYYLRDLLIRYLKDPGVR